MTVRHLSSKDEKRGMMLLNGAEYGLRLLYMNGLKNGALSRHWKLHSSNNRSSQSVYFQCQVHKLDSDLIRKYTASTLSYHLWSLGSRGTPVQVRAGWVRVWIPYYNPAVMRFAYGYRLWCVLC